MPILQRRLGRFSNGRYTGYTVRRQVPRKSRQHLVNFGQINGSELAERDIAVRAVLGAALNRAAAIPTEQIRKFFGGNVSNARHSFWGGIGPGRFRQLLGQLLDRFRAGVGIDAFEVGSQGLCALVA